MSFNEPIIQHLLTIISLVSLAIKIGDGDGLTNNHLF